MVALNFIDSQVNTAGYVTILRSENLIAEGVRIGNLQFIFHQFKVFIHIGKDTKRIIKDDLSLAGRWAFTVILSIKLFKRVLFK